jgi:hypothetical protein
MVDAGKTRDDLIQLAAIALREFHNPDAADLIMAAVPERKYPEEPPIGEHSKIPWIKWHRARYGSDLKTAKDAADELWAKNGL